MFGYMTDLFLVETTGDMEITVEGHDMQSLVFNFLEEWLFTFHSTGFVCKEIVVVKIETSTTPEGKTKYNIVTRGRGEKMDLKKHKQGTEVKAITYSAMKIIDGATRDDNEWQIFCIIDI